MIHKTLYNGLSKDDDALTVLRTMLVNIMALITTPFLLSFATILFTKGAYIGSLLLFITAFILIGVFYLNHQRRFLVAKRIVLTILCILTGYSIATFGRDIDIQILVLTMIIFVFILFDHRWEWIMYGTFCFLSFLIPYISLEKYGMFDQVTNVPYAHFFVMAFALLACSLLSYILMSALKKYLQEKDAATALLRHQNVELEQKNNYIQRQKEELELFTSIASHDLKTPIRTINSFIGLLEKGHNLSDPKMSQYLQYIKGGSKQLTKIINGLSDFNQIENFGESITTVQTKAIASESIAALPEAVKEQLDFSLTDLSKLKINETHLRHIFEHLIENALKYNQQKTKPLAILQDQDEKHLNIYIKDNGIGIPEEYSSYVFEPFKKLHASDKYESTGLGLSICKKILDLYNGSISFTQNEKIGSTFKISLPLSMVSHV